MKGIPAIIICTIIAMASGSCVASRTGSPTIIVLNVIGSAAIDNDRGERSIKGADKIAQGDTLVTGDKSTVDIIQNDRVIMRIYENSRVFFPRVAGKDGGNTQLFMNKGKIFIPLVKASKGRFLLDTPAMAIAIKGTSIRVTADESKTRLDVVSGTATIYPVIDGKVDEKNIRTVQAKYSFTNDIAAVVAVIRKKTSVTESPIPQPDAEEILKELNDIRESVISDLGSAVKNDFEEELRLIHEAVKGKTAAYSEPAVLIQGKVVDPAEADVTDK